MSNGHWTLPPHEFRFAVTPSELGEVVPWGITRLKAIEARQYSAGAGAIVAVIDTGIDATHPDLAGAIHPESKDFSGSRYGVQDHDGHGTHVSGTIAARHNIVGVDSMAPEAQILTCKALGDDGWGEDTWVAAAIRHAADVGAHVLNMSLGSPSPSPLIRSALEYAVSKNCLVCCAAGNSGPGPNTVEFPAQWDDVASAVAALDQRDRIASFSSRGPEVDCCAPGVHVLSSIPGNKYAYFDGTSMATPHLAGALAVVVAYRQAQGLPPWNQMQMIAALQKTSTMPQPSAAGSPLFGSGVVNLLGLLTADAAPVPTPPGPAPPQPPVKDPAQMVACFAKTLGAVLSSKDFVADLERRVKIATKP